MELQNSNEVTSKKSLISKKQKGITLIALVITIALNCSYLAMVVMK